MRNTLKAASRTAQIEAYNDMLRTAHNGIDRVEREATAEADTLAALVALPINGYSDAANARKNKFHSLARRRLRQVANALGLTSKDYDLRTNKAGIAVSGETTLHTDTLYIQISAGFSGLGEVMFRACDGRKDYSGRANHFANDLITASFGRTKPALHPLAGLHPLGSGGHTVVVEHLTSSLGFDDAGHEVVGALLRQVGRAAHRHRAPKRIAHARPLLVDEPRRCFHALHLLLPARRARGNARPVRRLDCLHA